MERAKLLRLGGYAAAAVLIIFGIGLLQVLLTAPGGLAQQLPRDMANLGRLVLRGVRSLRGPRGKSP